MSLAFARRHFADYKAPERIHLCHALPKNVAGKVQRRVGEVAEHECQH
jgi:acyl-coenzyme A synthetase/AMP-(fatty) acid ligase